MKRHENILVFGRPAATYNPQMQPGIPYARRWTPNKRNELGYGIKGVCTDNKGTRHPISILDFPQKWRRQDQLHPTQKPVELFEYLIKTYSNEGGLVLDNCIGSGTTAIACLNTGRRFIGFEKDAEIYDKCTQRIANHATELACRLDEALGENEIERNDEPAKDSRR